MAGELVIAPEAERDIAEAYAWYESSRFGLGEEFLGSIDACIEGIRRQPDMFSLIQEGYRRALVRRFPYAVFLRTSGEGDCGLCRVILPAIRGSGVGAFCDPNAVSFDF
jgi:plasmid stabilization system protein ParE